MSKSKKKRLKKKAAQQRAAAAAAEVEDGTAGDAGDPTEDKPASSPQVESALAPASESTRAIEAPAVRPTLPEVCVLLTISVMVVEHESVDPEAESENYNRS